MTDGPKRRTRLSKGRVRAIAWIAGATTFLTGWGVLGMTPKPAASADATAPRPKRPVIVVRKILRRVVITDPASSAPVRYVSGSGSTGAAVSGGSAPAPAPPPTTTTSGS